MFNVKHSSKETGNEGENIATKYLVDNGYDILYRNYKTRLGELDIITRKSGKIMFIEVKTIRQSANNTANDMFKPEDHLNSFKKDKLVRLAQMFAVEHSELINEDIGHQIDLIAIEMFNVKHYDLRHYENI